MPWESARVLGRALAVPRSMSNQPRSAAPERPPVRLDATDRFLRMFFVRAAQRAALAALAASAVSACANGPLYDQIDDPGNGPDKPGKTDPTESPGEWTPVPCASEGSFEVALGELELSQPVDYVALKHAAWDVNTAAEAGVPCQTASDLADCKQRLSSIDAHLGGGDDDCYEACSGTHYAVTTRGDDVEIWYGPEGLRELLGAIDSPHDAVLWLYTQDVYNLSCGDLEQGAYRETADGIEVRTLETTEWCEPYVDSRVTRLVLADGTVSITEEQVVHSDAHGCVAAGRRPQGLVAQAAAPADSALGRYFARMAHLEAASVHAFEAL
jgi:hypothetical protein